MFRFDIDAGAVAFDADDVITEVEHDDVVIYSIEMTTKYAQVLVYQGTSVVFGPSKESLRLNRDAATPFTTFTVTPPADGGDWMIRADVCRYTATVVVWRTK